MKKMSFWLMMLMLGLSTALWTGCSDDDNGEGNEQGGGEQGGSTVTKDTTWLVTTIKVNDMENEGFYKQVTLTWDKDSVVKEVKVGKYSPRGENGSPVTYPVTERTKDKVTIAFHDEDMGEDMRYVYTLNAKGYVTNVQRMYSEGEVEGEYSFEYANDQLVKIDLIDDDMTLFKATYDDKGNWATVMMAPDEGEGELIANCTASAKKNNYSLDLNLLMLMDDSYYAFDLVQCAVYLGLVPMTSDVLASVDVDGETVAVTAGEKDKRIETLKMDQVIDMVLTTKLKETEKK